MVTSTDAAHPVMEEEGEKDRDELRATPIYTTVVVVTTRIKSCKSAYVLKVVVPLISTGRLEVTSVDQWQRVKGSLSLPLCVPTTPESTPLGRVPLADADSRTPAASTWGSFFQYF
jgi:hypothetical protein